MSSWSEERQKALSFWRSLSQAEKDTVSEEILKAVGSAGNLAPLLREQAVASQRKAGTIKGNIHTIYGKAAAADLFGMLFLPSNTRRADKRTGLLIAYLLVHVDMLTNIFEATQANNLQVVESFWKAINAKDWIKFRDTLHPEYTWDSDTLRVDTKSPHFRGDGKDMGVQIMKGYFESFPDLHFEITHSIATRDIVVTRWVATGTQNGRFMGIEPTNRRGKIRGCTAYEIVEGKILYSEVFWDTGYLFQQMGVFPEKA